MGQASDLVPKRGAGHGGGESLLAAINDGLAVSPRSDVNARSLKGREPAHSASS